MGFPLTANAKQGRVEGTNLLHVLVVGPLTTGLFRDETQHSTAQHSTAQHSTAQHSTAQHSTAQHSTAQHSTAPLSGVGVYGDGCSITCNLEHSCFPFRNMHDRHEMLRFANKKKTVRTEHTAPRWQLTCGRTRVRACLPSTRAGIGRRCFPPGSLSTFVRRHRFPASVAKEH